MWNDGSTSYERWPDEDTLEGEDYDPTNLEIVRKYAKTIKGSWIEKTTIVK
jgi:hypothetical protein